MAKVIVRMVSKDCARLTGIEYAEAEDIFAAYRVSEAFGEIEVNGASLRTVQSKLQTAGHRVGRAQ